MSPVGDRQSYKSDLSDERWALIKPVVTSWKARHPSVSGHQGNYDMREIVNALLYQSRTGCQWDYLPHDLPPAGAVKYYFYRWRDDGTDQTIHDLLRWQVREKRGRLADPSLVVLDTQSLHAAAGVPAGTTGRDANKKVPGRKRGPAVDVLGLVITVVVLAASVHDNAFGTVLLDKVAANTGTVTKGPGGPGVQEDRRGPRAAGGHRGRSRRAEPGRCRVRPAVQAVDRGANERDLDAAPPTGARLRAPDRLGRVPGVLGDKRPDVEDADRPLHPCLAWSMTGGELTSGAVLVRLEEREREIAAQAEAAREKIAELTALLDGFDTAAEEIRITRKTLLELPDPPPVRAAGRETAGPSGLPADHGGLRRGQCPAAGAGGV
ncbi:Transposase [Streptomyces sp. MnatMP-M17]|nr:Transposase [Streptomyces sp. MnatMP-M17]